MVLTRPALNEVYLIAVSYVVLGTFLTLQLALTAAVLPRNDGNEAQGLWAAVLFSYITYALLPLRLQEAIAAGCVLGAAHLLCVLFLAKELHTSYVCLMAS